MAVRRKQYDDARVPLYLYEMAGAIERILRYTDGLSFSEFTADEMCRDAVQHQFEVLGEASSHVPFRMRQAYKQIPWSMMYELRNRIAHEYFDVDYEILWEIIRHDLPNDLRHISMMSVDLVQVRN